LTTKIISYEVPGNSTIVGKGTIIIIKKRDYIKPKILVEDRYLQEFLNCSIRNSYNIYYFYKVILDTIRSNKVYLVKELLRYNIPISSIYILEAVRGKAKDILTLLNRSADPNIRYYIDITPLSYTVKYTDLPIINLLLRRSSNIRIG
ncbi:hypothetical protein N7527_004674, partial [Penicillium freii]